MIQTPAVETVVKLIIAFLLSLYDLIECVKGFSESSIKDKPAMSIEPVPYWCLICFI